MPFWGLVAVITNKTPPSTMIGVSWAPFSLDCTGKIESNLMPMFSICLAGTTVSWAPVSAVPYPFLVLPLTLLRNLGRFKPRAAYAPLSTEKLIGRLGLSRALLLYHPCILSCMWWGRGILVTGPSPLNCPTTGTKSAALVG